MTKNLQLLTTAAFKTEEESKYSSVTTFNGVDRLYDDAQACVYSVSDSTRAHLASGITLPWVSPPHWPWQSSPGPLGRWQAQPECVHSAS